ncbi:MgtC/SapB family protein [Lactobacillus sp. PV034]|uniref:MgtC/SapB family protein n=1 Tax=Lactobacillus sp. PV034 TaxID=2594495 RepID=UPI002240D963|nr:MgtC/SapB family protein [Lactobacillus sp. PV034]QNQ80924.1 MgtC/SapB family protein [Lactobacillus sp. PV034]
MNQELDWSLRLLLAAFCGGLIGFERIRSQKEVGTRTHALIALGAALVMLISKYGFFDLLRITHLNWEVDPSRIAAQVVSGIGFLGAGVIINKHNRVSGLSTAAGIWVTGAIGLAYGSGLYVMGVVGTIFVLVTQVLGEKTDTLSIRRDNKISLFIKADMNEKDIEALVNSVGKDFFRNKPRYSLNGYHDGILSFYIRGDLDKGISPASLFTHLTSKKEISVVEKV